MLTSLFFIIGLLLCPSIISVPLSLLSNTTDHRFFPTTILTFPDKTNLVSALSSFGADELALHSIVTVPSPPTSFSETLLLARVHPGNQTIIWATAVTTIETDAGISIDPEGNVYIIASRHATLDSTRSQIAVIKHSFSGERVYETITSPKLDSDRARVRFTPAGDGRGSLFFVPPGNLVASALYTPARGPRTTAFLLFSAATGQFRNIRRFRPTRNIDPANLEITDFGAVVDQRPRVGGSFVCIMTRGSIILVQCKRVFGKSRTVSRVIDASGAFFFRGSLLEMENDPPANRAPSLFVVYERAFNFSFSAPLGESQARHELVLRRFDVQKLRRVDWKTGQDGGLERPILVSLPSPQSSRRVGTNIALRHLPETNTVAVLVAVAQNFIRILQQSLPGSTVIVEGDGGAFVFPEVYWTFFFDGEQQVSTRFISGDPRNNGPSDFRIVLSDFEISNNEEKVLFYGFLTTQAIESGPLFLQKEPNPSIRSHSTYVLDDQFSRQRIQTD